MQTLNPKRRKLYANAMLSWYATGKSIQSFYRLSPPICQKSVGMNCGTWPQDCERLFPPCCRKCTVPVITLSDIRRCCERIKVRTPLPKDCSERQPTRSSITKPVKRPTVTCIRSGPVRPGIRSLRIRLSSMSLYKRLSTSKWSEMSTTSWVSMARNN